MIDRIDKSFQKDIHKIGEVKIKTTVAEMILNIQEAEFLYLIKNLKKLSGHKSLYRIRMGNYRIGLTLTDTEELILIRFLHRKEIY